MEIQEISQFPQILFVYLRGLDERGVIIYKLCKQTAQISGLFVPYQPLYEAYRVNLQAQQSGQDIPNANLTAKGQKQTRFFYNSIFRRYNGCMQ